MILFDTSVLVSFDQLDVPVDDYVSSAVVLAELEFGVAVAKSVESYNLRRSRLARLRMTGLQWLPFTESTSISHAELMSIVHPEAPGKARSRELMIAATAYELGAAVATLNPSDFDRVASRVKIVVPTRRGPARQS